MSTNPSYNINANEYGRAVKYASEYQDEKMLTVLFLVKAITDGKKNEIDRLKAEYKKLFGKPFRLND